MENKKLKYKSVFMLIFVAFVWGGGFVATSSALETFSPFATMSIRFTISAGILFVMCHKKIRLLTKDEWKNASLSGIFLFLSFMFQTIGLVYTTASKNAFLTATNVIFIPYILWILDKKKPEKKQIIASIVCFFGISLLTLDGSKISFNMGDILSLVCALCFALHTISLGKNGAIDSILLSFVQMLVASFLSTILFIFLEEMPAVITIKSILSMGFLVIFSTLLAYVIQTKAQSVVDASTTSLILATESIFATILSVLILGERLTFIMVTGIILIFSSIIYSLKGEK